jgi:hypothetical protein
MGKRLRPGYSAWVNTDEKTLTITAFGPIPEPVRVFVESGGELPDNLADGEEARLDALGAFTPLAPYADRVRAQGARLVADAAPEGEASTKAGLVIPDIDDDDLPPPLPVGSVGPDGRVSADIAHGTAPEGEPVVPHVTAEEHLAAAQDQAASSESVDKTVTEHAKARRAAKK